MRARRILFWLRGFRWWAILALIAAFAAVVGAFTEMGVVRVLALVGLAVVLAILSTREEPT